MKRVERALGPDEKEDHHKEEYEKWVHKTRMVNLEFPRTILPGQEYQSGGARDPFTSAPPEGRPVRMNEYPCLFHLLGLHYTATAAEAVTAIQHRLRRLQTFRQREDARVRRQKPITKKDFTDYFAEFGTPEVDWTTNTHCLASAQTRCVLLRLGGAGRTRPNIK